MANICCTDVQLNTPEILASVSCELGMPVMVSEVLQLINTGKASAKSLSVLISQDEVLTLRMLKLANSPFYGIARKINTVQDAVVILGEKVLRNMVVAMAVKGMHGRQGQVENNIWQESVAFAMCASFVAGKIVDKVHSPAEAFMAGLMSNVGELLVNNDTPELYASIIAQGSAMGNREECSAALLPYSFAHLGAALLDDWNFSPLLVASTLYADETEMIKDSADVCWQLCAIVHFARKMCKSLGIGSYSAQHESLSSCYAATMLGFDDATVVTLVDEFAEFFAESASALESC
jgi:HD-like signal output (HDOD) protein